MGAFERVHQGRVLGNLTMFDRVIFKGHLNRFFGDGAVRRFLWAQGVPLKDFTDYAKRTTDEIARCVQGIASDAGRPVISFDHVKTRGHANRKDELARSIAERDGIAEGVVCVISAVESCWSFQVRRNHKTHMLEVARRERKCLHHYLYLLDPEFGFMHVRIQGWMPYTIQVYINGREWLARQLDKAGIGYVRYDNSLQRIDDLEGAWKLCETFAHRRWPRVLNAFAHKVNPVLPTIETAGFGEYYWVVDQVEIATDIMFKTRPDLQAVWPDLVRHATLAMSAEDVLGFLGRKLHPALAAEVATDAKRRPEGWRVKHRLARNWIKAYDKASVLRVETTINNPREFRVLRVFTDEQGRRERRWCEMRKGVADMWRHFQVGAAANRRYLDALAAAPLKGEGVRALDALCRPRTVHGRHHARFDPLSKKDIALFRAVLAGEYAVRGFRTRDITARLYRRPAADVNDAHRRCERVSRLIAKLRGHGLVAKVPRARRYRLTDYGHRVLTAAITLHDHTYPDEYLSAA